MIYHFNSHHAHVYTCISPLHPHINLLSSVGADPNHEGSLSEGPAFLLLCWHDLPRLYFLWMDCTGAVPREGNFLTGFEEITVMGVTKM